MRIEETTLCLEGLKFYAYHGVLEQERLLGNTFVVNLTLSLTEPGALTSDDVCHTLNYADVYKAVRAVMSQPVNLIEHLAWRIAHCLLESFSMILRLKVEVCKLNPPMNADLKYVSATVQVCRD